MEELSQNRGLVEEYVAEVSDVLDALNEQTIAFEESPEDLSLVNALFRGCHTVKGVSAMFGYFTVSELMHGMETVLDEIRAGERTVDSAVIATMFEGIDLARSIIDGIAQGSVDLPDTISFQQRIESLRGRGSAPTPAKSRDTAPLRVEGLPEHLRPHMDGYVLGRIREAVERRQTVYQMKIRFPVADEVDFRELFECVTMVGEPLLNVPCFDEILALDDFETEDCYLSFQYLLVSGEEEATIQQVIETLSGVRDIALDKLELGARSAVEGADAGDAAPTQQAVRVRQELLDALGRCAAEQRLVAQSLRRAAGKHEPGEAAKAHAAGVAALAERVETNFRETLREIRKVPIGSVFRRYKRLIRDLMASTGKNLRLETIGDAVAVDRVLAEAIAGPLVHLIRNAAGHGIEPIQERRAAGKPMQGTVSLAAFHREAQLVVRVEDDGRGLDRDAILGDAIRKGLIRSQDCDTLSDEAVYRLILEPGLSTASEVTELSGRGVGMDAVADFVDQFGGEIESSSCPGKGTRIEIRVPVILPIAEQEPRRAIVIKVGSTVIAVPEEPFLEQLEIPVPQLPHSGEVWRDQEHDRNVVIIDMGEDEERRREEEGGRVTVLILRDGDHYAGIRVDEIIGARDVLPDEDNGHCLTGLGEDYSLLDVGALFRYLDESAQSAESEDSMSGVRI